MRPTWLLAASGFLAAIGIVILCSCASPRDRARPPDSTIANSRRGPHGSHARNVFDKTKAPSQSGGCSNCGSGEQGQALESSYPLKTCVVSGKPLGTMGDPVEIDHEGTRVLLCCQGCVTKFQEDPEKYMASLHSATAEGPAPPGR